MKSRDDLDPENEVLRDRVSGLSAVSLRIGTGLVLGHRGGRGGGKRPATPGEEAPHQAGMGATGVGIADPCSEEPIGGKLGLSPPPVDQCPRLPAGKANSE